MSQEDRNMQIATFRFGVIAEFVTGLRLDYGEKERLLKQKLGRHYQIPYSEKTRITRSTIKKWINDYKKAGCQIEGLFPKQRKDKGSYRSLDDGLQLAAREVKREKPGLTGPGLIRELKNRKAIASHEDISLSVLYRFLDQEGLLGPNEAPVDRRAFEASYPNELWQSDVLHGPMVRADGKCKKSYLIAILDDHSRLVVHAEFYLSEKLADFKHCLKKAVEKRGLPQKLYTDNGSCFSALNVEQVTACLGIALKKAKPYSPQGKGKVERWFRTVRDGFLAHLKEKPLSLRELNECFDNWLGAYNNRVHSATKQTPLQRYRSNLECVRPAPANLADYFRWVEWRRVKKDRTFRLAGCLYEAPVDLIDKRVELRFHPEEPAEVEVFLDGLSHGKAYLLDKNVNFRIGRNNRVEATSIPTTPETGKLF